MKLRMALTFFPRLHRALKLAVKAHKKQDRDGKAPLPYVSHPIDVLNRLRYDGGETDEDVLCAAVLHDVLEESQVSPSVIEDKCGRRVLELVKEVTRREPPAPMTEELTDEEIWHLRTRLLLQEISAMSAEAKKIKLADRASNMASALVSKEAKDLYRYARQSEWILEKIDREICPKLWVAIRTAVDSVQMPEAYRAMQLRYEVLSEI